MYITPLRQTCQVVFLQHLFVEIVKQKTKFVERFIGIAKVLTKLFLFRFGIPRIIEVHDTFSSSVTQERNLDFKVRRISSRHLMFHSTKTPILHHCGKLVKLYHTIPVSLRNRSQNCNRKIYKCRDSDTDRCFWTYIRVHKEYHPDASGFRLLQFRTWFDLHSWNMLDESFPHSKSKIYLPQIEEPF